MRPALAGAFLMIHQVVRSCQAVERWQVERSTFQRPTIIWNGDEQIN
jgi:hypothetical protein